MAITREKIAEAQAFLTTIDSLLRMKEIIEAKYIVTIQVHAPSKRGFEILEVSPFDMGVSRDFALSVIEESLKIKQSEYKNMILPK